MKNKLLILLAVSLFVCRSYGQVANDSVRTRNDKPGTPQSLRTPDMSPQSHVTLINPRAATNQTVITVPPVNGKAVPKTSITLKNNPLNAKDSIQKEPGNKVSNVSNPIRH